MNQPATLTDGDGKVSNFIFNENRQLSSVQSGNGQVQRQAFDDAGHVTQVKNQTNAGQTISDYQYSCNADGTIKSVSERPAKH